VYLRPPFQQAAHTKGNRRGPSFLRPIPGFPAPGPAWRLSLRWDRRLSSEGVNASEALGLPRLPEGLERLEPLLTASVVTGDSFLDDVTTHLIAAGGKRLRPLLALAAATGGQREAGPDDLMGGVAVELVHLASLYHDDVLDEATIRRNVESVNSRFGNLVAIVAGDYLLARSAAIAAELGTEIAKLLADTLGKLCQGQVSEVRSAFQTDRTVEMYLSAIAGKTAALTSTSCRIGALTGKRSTGEVDALTEYGHCFGMVFQIRDDILDITATEGELLKPAGQDLAEGIYTLPALVALADAEVGPNLRALLGKPLDQPERDKACSIVAGSPGIAAAVDTARGYVERAKAATAGVEIPELRDGLTRLAAELLSDLPA
jgi:heptaprenyl diphosphate synthase